MRNYHRNLFVIIFVSVFISGCSALTTAIKKSDLDVKTEMSDTIWLDPVKPSDRTIFVQTKNTTSEDININQALKTRLLSKGYKVIDDPEVAHYWIQVNILKIDKMDLRESRGFLAQGYGSGLMGAAALGGIAAYNTHSTGAVLGAGLVGSLVGMAADAMVEDVNYSLITDIQIVEKSNVKQTTINASNIKQGNSGYTTTKSEEVSNLKRFQTRVVSNANQVNLELQEAKPKLIEGLTASISGIF